MPSFTAKDMMVAGRTTHRGVRYWESQGLLGEVERSAGKHRVYTAEQVQRAKIIAAAQMAGWSITDIRKYLDNPTLEKAEQLSLDIAATSAFLAHTREITLPGMFDL